MSINKMLIHDIIKRNNLVRSVSIIFHKNFVPHTLVSFLCNNDI